MENPVYIALSRQMALQRQMDVVAHNIANMNSNGYKGQRVLFQEFIQRPAIGEKLSMVQDYASLRDLRPGPMLATSNPLDLALQGNGYFVVESLSGRRYTRTGSFQINADRQVVDAGGLPLLGDNGQPLQIPQGAKNIDIRADGTVLTDRGQVGRLQVVRFEKEQFMTEVGGGLYVSDEEPQPAPEVKVVQGMLEQSNIQPVVELTQMIEINRQYQSNQKMMDSEHDRQRNAIGRLGRLAT